MLALPASNGDVLAEVINPALDYLSAQMGGHKPRCELLAIGRQEGGFAARQQVGGPAHGFWQFERNGLLAVMHHSASAAHVFDACRDFGVKYRSSALYEAIATNDIFACVLARLLLWTDPRPLPEIGDVMGAWDVYERCWRPGKPSYSRWRDIAYPQALTTMKKQDVSTRQSGCAMKWNRGRLRDD